MNVLQFWLIDSIVKASAYALASESSPRHSADYEPLFQGPEDDDGEHPQRHDIENPAPSGSRAHSISTCVEEHKTLSSRASTKTFEDEQEDLPPSSSTSTPSAGGSAAGTPRRRPSSHSPIPKRKRSPPPPLDLSNVIDSVDVSGARVIAVSGTPMTGRKESSDSGSILSHVSEKLSTKAGQGGRNNSSTQ